MSKTFEDINYRLRPAKSVERKMIVDLLTRLPHIRPLSNYRYIGFGSPYFSDVRLVHEKLHIDHIISIEREEGEKPRFEFNKPYDCVKIKFGESKDVLPAIDWDTPTILWLDYSDKISSYMFSDFLEFMTSAPAGSVIFVTINAHPASKKELDEQGTLMLEKLEERISRDMIPEGLEEKDFRGWGYGKICRRIILNQINEKYLDARNAGVEPGEELEFKQLVNFRYQDGAKMMTFGGMLYADKLESDFDDAAFNEFSFYRPNDDPYIIRTPILTFDEMRDLNKKLPGDIDERSYHAPNRHVTRYSELYRYFPKFIESEI